MSVMPTVSSKWNVGFQAQEQLRTVLLTEWKAAIKASISGISGSATILKIFHLNLE
jgi:hypothetical protein